MKLVAGLSLGAFVFVVALGAQEGPASPPRRDTIIEQLVNDAGSLPPEFNADVLIRLSQLPKVDKVWRREMLEEAFMRAYGAPEPYRRATTTQVPPDSRQ